MWLVAPMVCAPPARNRSLYDTPRWRNLWVAFLENGLELRDQTWQKHSSYTQECFCEVCLRSSKPFSNGRGHKFSHRRHAHAPRARDTPVAARMTKTERRRPVFKAGPSTSIHPPPTLTRGPTGKAVLALEVRSRTLHGHAPWPRSGARRRVRRQKLRDDLRVLWLNHRVLCLSHLPWPWEQWERPP